MPLQVRRGTNAQRQAMSEPLASGELLYATDTGTLYIGNGSTLGGIAVANTSNQDIRDIASSMLTTGTHAGISFTYDGTVIDAVVDPDLSNYQGVIRASAFQGTLVGDDSTILIDALSNKIELDGTVKGNIIPDANEAYDIGSSTVRFKDLYLSGTTIDLGGAAITSPDGSTIDLPPGSTVGGFLIGSGEGGGLVPGSNYKINIIGDDSTVLVNSATNTLSGIFQGDLSGSVFGVNSAVIVDATSNTVTGSFVGSLNAGLMTLNGSVISVTGSIPTEDPIFRASSTTGFIRVHPRDGGLEIRGLVDPGSPSTNNTIQHYVSRGTDTAPTIVAPGDSLGTTFTLGYDGSTFQFAGVEGFVVDPRYTPTAGSVRALYTITFPDRVVPDDTIFSADTDGVLATPVAMFVKPLADPTARDAALPSGVVQAGMIVFLADSTGAGGPAKLQVNTDGTTGGWVDLH